MQTMAESPRDGTMQALARLSKAQAVMLATAWPVVLVALPYVIALVRRAMVMMSAARGGGIRTMIGFHMHVASWPALIALLVVPPAGFLYAWRVAKRS
jgi:hypothetical protein